jgi:hypothetical protein
VGSKKTLARIRFFVPGVRSAAVRHSNGHAQDVIRAAETELSAGPKILPCCIMHQRDE